MGGELELQCSCDFFDLVRLERVTFLDVIEFFELDPAFHPALNFFGVVLFAFQ